MPPAAQVHGGGAQVASPWDWFQSLPIITRCWFGTSLAVTVAANFGLVDSGKLLYYWPAVYGQFELWRLLTCFLLVGPFEFATLIALFLLMQFSQRYESSGPFNTGAGGGTADYAFMLLLCMALVLLTFPLVSQLGRLQPMFARTLIHCVLYVWSKRHPTAQANIWGIPVPANYLPFAYLALSVFVGGQWLDQLHGMAVGHLYYFVAEVVPQVQGRDFLQTPQFLIERFGIGEYRPDPAAQQAPPPQRGFGNAAAPPPAGGGGGGGGHNWGGGGRALGHD